MTLLNMPAFADEVFSLYLVRHAEKQASKDNPALTACGRLRAQQLATLLEKAEIKAIYSTQYQRTLATAKPLSQQQTLAIKHYSPSGLEQFALQLKQHQQNALVVGHSNTTPMLAELLSGQGVAAISEQQYQNLYQIQFSNNKTTLTQFKQPLLCRT